MDHIDGLHRDRDFELWLNRVQLVANQDGIFDAWQRQMNCRSCRTLREGAGESRRERLNPFAGLRAKIKIPMVTVTFQSL